MEKREKAALNRWKLSEGGDLQAAHKPAWARGALQLRSTLSDAATVTGTCEDVGNAHKKTKNCRHPAGSHRTRTPPAHLPTDIIGVARASIARGVTGSDRKRDFTIIRFLERRFLYEKITNGMYNLYYRVLRLLR